MCNKSRIRFHSLRTGTCGQGCRDSRRPFGGGKKRGLSTNSLRSLLESTKKEKQGEVNFVKKVLEV